ncbi:MAG: RidA family protein, partial [Acidobacteria bacterium]
MTDMRVLVLCSIALLLVPFMATLLPAQQPTPGLPFSRAVVAGDFVYLSGTLPTDASGKVAGDIRQQTARTLDNLAALLEKSGSSMDR